MRTTSHSPYFHYFHFSHHSHHFHFSFRLLLALVLFTITVLPGCSDGDEGPTQPTSFALLLTNKTPTDYNVYQRPSEAGDVFGKVGVAPSGAMYRINPLTPGTNYVFRLVRDGMNLDEFEFEKNVSSTGVDVSWEVK